jgi:hypothetical protein
MPPTVNRWLDESSSNAVAAYSKDEVYTKAQSDSLTVVPPWGHMLVATSTLRFKGASMSFLTGFGPQFNLTHSYLNPSEVRFDFLTYKPTNSDYMVTFNTDNQLTQASSNLVHAKDQTIDGFTMFVKDAEMTHGGHYTVQVFYHDMVLV